MSNLEPNSQTPLILAVDSSSARASMALSLGAEILGFIGLAGGEKRSTNLINEIDWLLARLSRESAQIDAFAVITGPGSFTGLRVGLATIKGFAHALAKPVIGLSSLAVAARAGGISDCSCALINAHRGELFAQLFSVDERESRPLSEAAIVKIDDLLDQVIEFQRERDLPGIVFCGDGALLHANAIAGCAQVNGIAFQAANLLTAKRSGWIVQSQYGFLAADAARCAREKFLRGETITAAQLAAYYIRPAEAEVKLRLGLIGKKKNTTLGEALS